MSSERDQIANPLISGWSSINCGCSFYSVDDDDVYTWDMAQVISLRTFVLLKAVNRSRGRIPTTNQRHRIRRTPRGKLCLIYAKKCPDSSGIIHYLETRHAIRLMTISVLKNTLRALIQSVFEEHLYFILIYRGGPTKLLEPLKAHLLRYFDDIGVPSLLQEARAWSARKSVQQNIWGQGVGRMDREAVHGKGVEILQSLSTLLDDRAFFVGNEPNSYDACAYAFLASIIRPHIPSPLQTSVRHFDNLVGYCERMRKLKERRSRNHSVTLSLASKEKHWRCR